MRILMRMVKRAVNLSIDEAKLAQARALKLNLSRLLEESLDQRLQKERERQWLEENREAIEAYNERIRRDGPLNRDLTRI